MVVGANVAGAALVGTGVDTVWRAGGFSGAAQAASSRPTNQINKPDFFMAHPLKR
jgi:hypothetical protein